MEYSRKEQAAFMGKIKGLDCRQYLELLFLYSASPVLCGAKPAELVTIKKDLLKTWKEHRGLLYRTTRLQIYELHRSRKSLLILIYDNKMLESTLSGSDARELLSYYGYPGDCDAKILTESMVRHLKSRFGYREFPHEIGLFLGYPSKDVAAFIKNAGKKSSCCRHWKVYHNVEQAKEIFKRIDEAKRYALELLEKPVPIHTAAALLKATGDCVSCKNFI